MKFVATATFQQWEVPCWELCGPRWVALHMCLTASISSTQAESCSSAVAVCVVPAANRSCSAQLLPAAGLVACWWVTDLSVVTLGRYDNKYADNEQCASMSCRKEKYLQDSLHQHLMSVLQSKHNHTYVQQRKLKMYDRHLHGHFTLITMSVLVWACSTTSY